jgi:hypothetical protein
VGGWFVYAVLSAKLHHWRDQLLSALAGQMDARNVSRHQPLEMAAVVDGSAGPGTILSPVAQERDAAFNATTFAAVRCQDVHMRFPTRHGFVHALDGLSLCLYYDETFVLLGPNGAGKVGGACSRSLAVPLCCLSRRARWTCALTARAAVDAHLDLGWALEAELGPDQLPAPEGQARHSRLVPQRLCVSLLAGVRSHTMRRAVSAGQHLLGGTLCV